jgi:uncharacterized delta-60 repeat protein
MRGSLCRLRRWSICFALLGLSLVGAASGASGDLDTSFGVSGIRTMDVGPADLLTDLTIEPGSGRIVAVGTTILAAAGDPFVVRLLADGSPDPSFGGGDGVVTLDLGDHGTAWGAATRPDGKIVLAAEGDTYGGAVARLNEDGSLDTSFSGDGIFPLTGPAAMSAPHLVLQEDGRIVVTGFVSISGEGGAFGVARVLVNGSGLDPTFSGGVGATILNPGGTAIDQPEEVAIDGKDRIVVAGETWATDNSSSRVAVARLTLSGQVDGTFDGDGIVLGDPVPNPTAVVGGMVVQPDERIVITANLQENTVPPVVQDSAVVRYTEAGVLDSSFDADGRAVVDFGSSSTLLRSVVLRPDGRIVAAGSAGAVGARDFGVASLLRDGSPDTSFGGDGTVTQDAGTPRDLGVAVAIQPDGRLVVGGFGGTGVPTTGPLDLEFLRLLGEPGGSAQADFDGDGATDVSVFHAGSQFGEWFVQGQPPFPQLWGTPGDVPVPANYDADPQAELAVFRRGAQFGEWYVQGQAAVSWGAPGDTPVSVDYNGDGVAERAVFRAGQAFGEWYIEGQPLQLWGAPTDVPVPGDYDGDGNAELAVFRQGPTYGEWYIQGQPLILWGAPGDIPVPADYNGDGTTDIAVFRRGATYGEWYVRGGAPFVLWGSPTDLPMPGDYDGDGDANIAVFRRGASFGEWYIQGKPPQLWGDRCDTPLPLPYHLLELLPIGGC